MLKKNKNFILLLFVWVLFNLAQLISGDFDIRFFMQNVIVVGVLIFVFGIIPAIFKLIKSQELRILFILILVGGTIAMCSKQNPNFF